MLPSLAESAAMADDQAKNYKAFLGYPVIRWDIGISMRTSVVLRFHFECPLDEDGSEYTGHNAPVGMGAAEARQLAADLIEVAEVIEARDAPKTVPE